MEFMLFFINDVFLLGVYIMKLEIVFFGIVRSGGIFCCMDLIGSFWFI